MTDVLFYDFDFNLLGDFPRAVSVNIERKFCGYGCAEVHFSVAEKEVIALLEENPYMFFVAKGCSVIVTGWRIGEDIAVLGRTAEWLLTKRGIEQGSWLSLPPEEIAGAMVQSAAGDFLTVSEPETLGDAQNYSTNEVKVLYDAVCQVLQEQSRGFEVFCDIPGKQFVFRTLCGEERPALVSKSNRTAHNMEYTVDRQKTVSNSGWYERTIVDMGDWDADKNIPPLAKNDPENAFCYYRIITDDSRFGLECNVGDFLYSDTEDGTWKTSSERPESRWVYFGNTAETGPKKWDAVLSGAKTKDEAQRELGQMKTVETSSALLRRIEYGVDYGLGDVVNVQLEFGDFKKTEKKRVTAVKLFFDVDESGAEPTLSSLEE